MPYTIADWIRANAKVQVQLPTMVRGEITGNLFPSLQEVWIPLAVLLGMRDDTVPDWYYWRTIAGREIQDFSNWKQAEEGE